MPIQTANLENEKQANLPATMKAVVYRGVNDLRLEIVPVPAIGPGELLVKIAACGVCGTDLKKIHTGSHSAPRIFGHEMAGTIVKMGEGVANFALGDRVMVFHHIPCGKCYYCRKKHAGPVPAIQKSGRHCGHGAFRRRLFGVHSCHGLDRGQPWRGLDSRWSAL